LRTAREVTKSIVAFVSSNERSFTTGITSSIVVKVGVKRTRELAVIHSVSVDCQEGIVAAIDTSTIPVEVPTSRAGIITEISIPLMSIFMWQSTIIRTCVVEIQSLIFIALEAAEIFGTGCDSIEWIGTCLVTSVIPIEVWSRSVTRPITKVSVPLVTSNIGVKAFGSISTSLVIEESLIFSSTLVTTKISVS